MSAVNDASRAVGPARLARRTRSALSVQLQIRGCHNLLEALCGVFIDDGALANHSRGRQMDPKYEISLQEVPVSQQTRADGWVGGCGGGWKALRYHMLGGAESVRRLEDG